MIRISLVKLYQLLKATKVSFQLLHVIYIIPSFLLNKILDLVSDTSAI